MINKNLINNAVLGVCYQEWRKEIEERRKFGIITDMDKNSDFEGLFLAELADNI